MTVSLAWPSDVLPAVFMRDGFSYQRQPAVIRTDMESPAPRARLVNRNPLANVPVACIMTSTQVDFFKAWLESDAGYGGAWFYVDVPISFDETRTLLSRITGEPVITPYAAAKWKVAFTLEARDPNIVSGDVLTLVRTFGATGTQDMAASLAEIDLQPFIEDWAAGAGR
jgi:hypothetical protein